MNKISEVIFNLYWTAMLQLIFRKLFSYEIDQLNDAYHVCSVQ